MPDLPGPIKMRQLLIWAAQRTSRGKGHLQELSDSLVQALITNKVNTSWYQRGANEDENSESSALVGSVKNQETMDCIQLYERYYAK